jgi:glycosyltransferase involved in cell wall biosynthesis
MVVNHAGFFLSHRLPIAVAAREAGFDVHIATPRSKHVPRIEAAGLAWHEIQLSRSGLNPIHELQTIRSLWRLYRKVRPSIVHHVTSKPVLYGTRVARAARVPAVVNAISGLGHVFASDDKSLAHRALRRLINVGYRMSLRHPRMRVIFQNADHRDAFLSRGYVRPEECVMIAGSGVDPATFIARDNAHAQTEPVRVVFASRMLYTKGLREFVDAARMLKNRGVNARFILVGEPDPDNLASASAGELQAWQDEGVVEYRGRSEEMPAVFRDADVVCLPSYSEGMPKVLIEAASCALPIVTTDIPGCRDVVRDDDNGLLVPLRDAEAVAAALARLIDDRALRERMGRRGRERVLSEFALPIVIKKTLDVYEQLIT